MHVLFHPNECLDAGDRIEATRRTKNPIEYLFADLIRHKLKLKNLGMNAVKLMGKILTSASEDGFEFVSAGDYMKQYKSNLQFQNTKQNPQDFER